MHTEAVLMSLYDLLVGAPTDLGPTHKARSQNLIEFFGGLPGAPLFASALGALGLFFGWRRRRKTRSILPA